MKYFTIAPEGLEATSGDDTVHKAIIRLLTLVYRAAKPSAPQRKGQAQRQRRNAEIGERYAAGERASHLADECGMTVQALYKMMRETAR